MKAYAVRVAVLLLVGALCACGGSGTGNDGGSSIGSSQNPDPVIVDFPVAYVKRPLLVDDDGALVPQDVRTPLQFRAGAQLWLRDRATPSAAERVLTDQAFATPAEPSPQYDVRGLSVSFDGTELLFAMRAPEIPNADEDEQPKWNIWRYDVPTRDLRRVIFSDTVAEAGDDIDPQFLPDGRIVFTSNRQRRTQAILLDEGKPQYQAQTDDRDSAALLLHVMNPDGTGITQISFNVSHDLNPAVTQDGHIVYSRWDNARGRDRISLYRARPDGREMSLLYGYHSHDSGTAGATVEFMRPRELVDGRLLSLLSPRGASARIGTEFVAVDVGNYVEVDQPTAANASLTGPGQDRLIRLDVRSDDTISPAGRYASAFPLNDGSNRLLVTWSQCRLLEGVAPNQRIVPCGLDPNSRGLPEANPLYGLWVFDVAKNTQQPVLLASEGGAVDEAVVMASQTLPAVLLDAAASGDADQALIDEDVGVLHLATVYDLDGVDTLAANGGITTLRNPSLTPAAQRPARFVRLEKPVLMPSEDVLDFANTGFGASAAEGMREIIGYAPVEPDGSVMVKVPADVAFTVSILDANGRRTSARHQHWLQVRPGEVLGCPGCHTAQSERPHGRADAQPVSANPGAPLDGPFPNANDVLFAEVGETMAQTRARWQGLAAPNPDVSFTDEWTDPDVATPAAAFAYRYADLNSPAPISIACLSNWQARCRAVIHYPDHIHPLWEVNRQILDVDGVTVLEDRTCTSCHTTTANNVTQVPAAQLELTGGPSPDEADHLVSYRELLFGDVEQEVVGGVLRDRLVQDVDANGNPLFQTDQDGNLILDAQGNPIPVLVTVPVAQTLSVNGARASPRFFAPFAANGTHQGFLTPAELRLVSEWIDMGGQYYNDPFLAPLQ